MKQSAVDKKRNSFSIDSIIASSKSLSESRTGSPVVAPGLDARSYGPAPVQLPLHSRSIPTDIRLSPSLQPRTAMAYDERELVMRQRSMFDYNRYPNAYDNAVVAQFAAAAAAMATMTPSAGTVGSSARHAVSDPVSYASYWMHANRQHASPALFLPGKHSTSVISHCLHSLCRLLIAFCRPTASLRFN